MNSLIRQLLLLLGIIKQYLFAPRFSFNRFQFNLVAVLFIGIGLLAGSYLTAKNLIPKIFATSQASITVDTDTDFNKGTLASIQVSGVGTAAIMELSNGGGGPSGTQYKKAVTINNSSGGVLTNYQVQITADTASLVTAGKLQSNCNDIRFTDSDGSTALNYYISSGCNTSSTIIYVNIPSISNTSNYTIYLYYGAPSASAGSSFSSTFTLPTAISGLKLWLKADTGVYIDAGITPATDGQAVQQWNDQSGNGNNAIQTTSGLEPTFKATPVNGNPGILFSDATSANLTISNFSSQFTSSASYFVVYNPQGDTQYGLFATGNNDGYERFYGDGNSYPALFKLSGRIESYRAMPSAGNHLLDGVISTNFDQWLDGVAGSTFSNYGFGFGNTYLTIGTDLPERVMVSNEGFRLL